MKKQTIFYSLFLAIIFILNSCDPTEFKPPDNKINRLKWVYDIGDISATSLPNPVPAIDENGNIYASVSCISKDDFIKLNSSGETIWSRKAGSISSRIVYSDNFLYYTKNSTSLVCASPSDGSEKWVKDNVINGTFAVTRSRIYTTDFRDNGIFGINYLKAFDLQGNKIWVTKLHYSDTDTINFPYALSVYGNDIYVGVLEETGNKSFAILKYHDNGTDVIKKWSWLAPDNFKTEGTSGKFKDIAIDKSGNIYFSMKKDNKHYIFSISPDGDENWHSETSRKKIISSVTVDRQGDVYSSYSTTEKTGASGSIWNTALKSGWSFEGFASKGPVLSNNGNSYSLNESKLLTAIDNDGNILWEQYYEPGEDTGLSADEQFQNITLNKNGDIIVIGRFEIKCFKGDGSGLLEDSWPKLYGNYGNTASR